MLMTVWVAVGLWSAFHLPVDAVPDITNNQVQVITTSTNLAAQEMELLVTAPLEMALSSLPEKLEIRSISRFGLSVITLVFKDEVDVYKARQWVSERLATVAAELPAGVSAPELGPPSTGLSEIYQYTLEPQPGYEQAFSLTRLRDLQDWIVKRQLLGTEGVADVSSFGGFVREVEVAVKSDRLKALGLTMADLMQSLEGANANTGSAYVTKGDFVYFIRGIGMLKDPKELEQVVVRLKDHSPVLLRDLATIQEGHSVRYGAMTYNGKGEAVGGIVLMLKGRNSKEVIEAVKSRMTEVQQALPPGLKIVPFIDRTKLIDNAIGTVLKNLTEGGLIVIFVLVLILGNLRAGLIVASVIPLSLLFAITMMRITGISGNLMSLGAIDFGLVVDGAVIIIEFVLHQAHLRFHNRLPNKLEMQNLSEKASGTMMNAAVFGQLIIMIVYLPILSLGGVEGKMFKPMAWTVAFMLIGALILCLTWVPMMASMPALAKKSGLSRRSDAFFDRLSAAYKSWLKVPATRPLQVMSIALVLFVLAIWQFGRSGGEFIPTLEEGDFAVETRVVLGSSIDKTAAVCTELEAILLQKFPEVKSVVSKIGTSEIPTDPMPMESADMIIELKDKSEWVNGKTIPELAEKMKQAVSELPGVAFSFQQPIQMRFNELMTGVKTDVAVKIYGSDMALLADKAEQVGQLISSVPGVKDISVERVEGLPQRVLHYRLDRLAQYGLHVQDLNRVVEAAFAGTRVGTYYEEDRRYAIRLRLPEEQRNRLSSVEELMVDLPSGGQIPLAELAEVRTEEGPLQISRDQARRRITVGLNVRGRDVASVVEDIRKLLDSKLPLPAGYHYTYGGQFENLVLAKERLAIAVPVALLLILVLLYFSFQSVPLALLIFTAVPLSAIGGVGMLALREMPFSISAGVGFIALFGVAVLNGLVMVNAIREQEQAEGGYSLSALLEACSSRLRPVLMTAMVASLGFLPMAISTSAGAEVQKPLATVVIGGLISATLLTLFVLPTLYHWMRGRSSKPTLKTVLPVVLLLMFSSPLMAQTPLSLEQAQQRAIKQHGRLEAARLRVKETTALGIAARAPGRTSFDFMQGQINSALRDQAFQINQSSPFPTVYGAVNGYWKLKTQSQEAQLALDEREIKREVKKAYHVWQFHLRRQQVLDSLMFLYQHMVSQTEIARGLGEVAGWQQQALNTRVAEIRMEKGQSALDVRQAYTQLLFWMQEEGEPDFKPVDSLETWSISQQDSGWSATDRHPLGMLAKLREQEAEAWLKVERRRFLPELSIGYLNQSIDKRPNNQVVALGVSLPLFFRPYRQQIVAARLQRQIASAERALQESQLVRSRQAVQWRKQQVREKLSFYTSQGLPSARSLELAVNTSRRLGEITSFEWLQSVNQIAQIRLGYLQSLLDARLLEADSLYFE